MLKGYLVPGTHPLLPGDPTPTFCRERAGQGPINQMERLSPSDSPEVMQPMGGRWSPEENPGPRGHSRAPAASLSTPTTTVC